LKEAQFLQLVALWLEFHCGLIEIERRDVHEPGGQKDDRRRLVKLRRSSTLVMFE